MFKNELIEIERVEITTDEAGDQVKESTWREVFAEKKSIGAREFYQAHADGLQPEYKFVVHSTEYDRAVDGPGIKYLGRRYRIIRVYEADFENIELTVEGDIHANA